MVSFVIRTKNEEKRIEEVIQSILSQKNCGTPEIIIVDSGSTDHTLDIAKQYGCKVIQIEPEEFTWGYALNIGIASAKNSIIGLISGHCVLNNCNVVKYVLEDLNNTKAEVVYGRQIGEVGVDPFEAYDLFYYYKNIESTYVHFFESEPEYVTTISNACCFFKKNIWERVKFDERVSSAEDTIWANKLLKLVIPIGYDSRIEIIHSHPLNLIYIYKKNYWREKEMAENITASQKPILYYYIRNLIKKPFCDMLKYQRGIKVIHGHATIGDVMAYTFVVNYAIFRANYDIKKKRGSKSYSLTQIPNIVIEINNKHRFIYSGNEVAE